MLVRIDCVVSRANVSLFSSILFHYMQLLDNLHKKWIFWFMIAFIWIWNIFFSALQLILLKYQIPKGLYNNIDYIKPSHSIRWVKNLIFVDICLVRCVPLRRNWPNYIWRYIACCTLYLALKCKHICYAWYKCNYLYTFKH